MPAAKTALQPPSDATSSPISHFPAPLTERDLSRLWRDQTFPAEALVTATGERLRVVYRGRPGGGAGPDFRDALVATRGGLLQGDVELHVRSSDFHRHGHDRDPAYAGVVLHLVFRDDEGERTALPGGGSAAVVALGDWARGRAAEIGRWLKRPALWREPCFSSRGRLGPAEVEATLERLGDMRFRQKAAAFAKRLREMEAGRGKEEGGDRRDVGLLPSSVFLLPGAEQLLWEALLEALAFGSVGDEFRLLAQRLPWAELQRLLVALPARERGGEARGLLGAAAGTISSFAYGGRPAGRPERRLRGAAQLAARFAEKGLVWAFAGVVKEGSTPIERGPSKTEIAKTQSAKNERKPNHRSTEFRFSNSELRAQEPKRVESRAIASLIALLTVPGLIGRSRAVEMAGNAVLPWLAALGPEARTRRAEALYRRLPLSARYGAVRHLHEAVGSAAGENEKRKAENGKRQGDDGGPKTESGGRPGGNASPGSLGGLSGRQVVDREPHWLEDATPDRGVRVDFRRQQGMLYLLKQYSTRERPESVHITLRAFVAA